MIEELSEPINPKLKDPKAFATACADVSYPKNPFFILLLQILVLLCMCQKWIP